MKSYDHISRALQDAGIKPSAQRMAIAQFVLNTDRHPTADEVLKEVRRVFPMVSRATVYNTLKLFVGKGLLRSHQLVDGLTVFDSNVERHHHFIDEETGDIVDIPWDSVGVEHLDELKDFEISSWMVVMRGRKRP